MKLKLIKWFFIVFYTLFITGIFSIVYICYNQDKYYQIREYLNPNSIQIRVTNNLDSSKVNVYWSAHKNSGQIIKKGKTTNLIYKEYGKNKFVVLYEKDTVKNFMYFKTNNWHGHEHIISLSKEEGKEITVNIEINGPDNYFNN